MNLDIWARNDFSIDKSNTLTDLTTKNCSDMEKMFEKIKSIDELEKYIHTFNNKSLFDCFLYYKKFPEDINCKKQENILNCYDSVKHSLYELIQKL